MTTPIIPSSLYIDTGEDILKADIAAEPYDNRNTADDIDAQLDELVGELPDDVAPYFLPVGQAAIDAAELDPHIDLEVYDTDQKEWVSGYFVGYSFYTNTPVFEVGRPTCPDFIRVDEDDVRQKFNTKLGNTCVEVTLNDDSQLLVAMDTKTFSEALSKALQLCEDEGLIAVKLDVLV